jgi:hypothetical protein
MTQHWLVSHKQFSAVPTHGVENRMQEARPEKVEPEKEDQGVCPYCKEHNLYEESPWLRRTGTHHSFLAGEQQTLFDPERFNR